MWLLLQVCLSSDGGKKMGIEESSDKSFYLSYTFTSSKVLAD